MYSGKTIDQKQGKFSLDSIKKAFFFFFLEIRMFLNLVSEPCALVKVGVRTLIS